ncbi:SET-domain containing protein lysine methyltransferase family protein [Actinidia rufa]|uniref:SET-domain containing protein lysine methyltransferase family protein n=1 Tax=Actinidia rufa TaxID=165716 RepID=A0A7J0GRU5_9ERIC|nr:SET-domain containing protein lysine methyltransferase family protein [Actinidia rufa]
MAPNARVVRAFRAMKVLGIPEEKVKPVLKDLVKLYDKNWELIEEENYRALADAIFEQEEIQAAEQKKKREDTDQREMDEEAQVHEEPERPLKRLRLRSQEGRVSPSVGNSSSRMGAASLRPPKTEESELPDTCPEQWPQDMPESSQLNAENIRAGSHLLSPQSLVRNKGKQPVVPKPLSVKERFHSSQLGAVDTTDLLATSRTEPVSISPPLRLREIGKEPLSPQFAPRDERISGRSPHAVHLEEHNVEHGIGVFPKQVHNSNALIKPKDEPFSKDIPQFEVPIAVIYPDPLSKETSSTVNGLISEPDELEPLASQLVPVEDRNEGNPASSSDRRLLENTVDESSSNLEIASAPSGEESIDVIPAVDLLNQCHALDCSGDRSKSFGSSNGVNDFTSAIKTVENVSEIDKEKEQNGLERGSSQSLVLVQQRQPMIDGIRILHDVKDIAKGEERVGISLANEINDDRLPSFHYIPRNVTFQNAQVTFSLARIGEKCCSTCFGNCLSSPTPCACAHDTRGDFAYTLEGLLKEEFLEECISVSRNPPKHCLFRSVVDPNRDLALSLADPRLVAPSLRFTPLTISSPSLPRVRIDGLVEKPEQSEGEGELFLEEGIRVLIACLSFLLMLEHATHYRGKSVVSILRVVFLLKWNQFQLALDYFSIENDLAHLRFPGMKVVRLGHASHPVTDESVVGISVSAAREFAAFVPTFSPRR